MSKWLTETVPEHLKRHWPSVVAGLTATAMVAVFSWLKARYGSHTRGDWHSIRGPLLDAGLAVSGALLVALVVGVFIDRAARQRLAENLAEGWLWGLLGEDAPPQIQQRAKQILAERVILSLVQVTVTMSWVDPEPANGPTLHLDVRSLNTGTNFGPDPFRVQPTTRLVPSVAGHHSCVTNWQFEVYPKDRAQRADHVEFDQDQFPKSPTDAVVFSLHAKELEIPEHLAARRGDGFRLQRTASIYLGPADTFPVGTGRPSLETFLVLKGPALSDLTVEVIASQRVIDPVADENDQPDELRFQIGSTLGGEWFWVCWAPRDALQLPGVATPQAVTAAVASGAPQPVAQEDPSDGAKGSGDSVVPSPEPVRIDPNPT